MTYDHPPRDIARTMLAVLFIGILLIAACWIIYPFLTAIIWSATIVVTTWPLMLALQARLGGRRRPAVAVMTAALVLVFIIPFTCVIVSIVERADEIAGWSHNLASFAMPPSPGWLEHLPLAGPKLAARWNELAATPAADLSQRLAPHARKVAGWLVARAGNIGMMTVQFFLTVIISAILYANGEAAARGILRFARRLAGRHGEDAAVLAAKAVRGVALGVVVTALIQALLGGGGLALVGAPAALVLTGVMFVLCVAQVGPTLVLIPAVAWLYWKDQNLWGTILLVWGLVVCTIDNFIRPLLIRQSADLPLVLIFAGVLGGLLAFGVIGLFIGPVLLAVGYTLLESWIERGESEAAGEEEFQGPAD